MIGACLVPTMTFAEIESTVFRWHMGLYQDLIAKRILPVQFLAGVEVANLWALERYCLIFTPSKETDICPTTSF